MSRLLIMGPPGAGKGTQGKLVAQELGIPKISTGDIFRSNVQQNTPLGIKVKDLLAAGSFVPDELTNDLVQDRLAQSDAQQGFLLDGYPRTLGQVKALDDMLEAAGVAVDGVLQLEVDHDALVQRLLDRAAVEGRADDDEHVIAQRMKIYQDETAPITQCYAQRGLVAMIDGMGTVDEVTTRTLAAAKKAVARA